MSALHKIIEGTTPILELVIKDENDNRLAASALDTVTLTYFDARTKAIINSRNAQDVLNDNSVTIDSNGNLLWFLLAADTAASDPEPDEAVRRLVARFIWTWTDTGSRPRVGQEDIEIRLKTAVALS